MKGGEAKRGPSSDGKLWRLRECDEGKAAALAATLRAPVALGRLLAGRGITEPDAAERFLSPRLSELEDPFLLPQMDGAVARLARAIHKGETIAVYGDYDVDGVSSTALLVKVLVALGGKARPFLPLRMDEGYGLTVEGLERCLHDIRPGLIVTVDCGTGSLEASLLAAKKGVDLVVTDHHAPGPSLAKAAAVVNPKLGEERFHALAGVGVAFKLCHALLKHARAGRREGAEAIDLKEHLDLVALGTISDIVPLTGENRVLASHGLQQLNKTLNLGLRTLAEVAGIKGRIDAYEVGFRIGPRLNAAGRLGDALHALELLLTDDPARALELARDLDASNRERQDVEASIVAAAIEDLDAAFDPDKDFGLVAARPGWHSGVIGIVASRLVQRYNRPVVVIALEEDGSGRGSCRSIEGFDILEGLRGCEAEMDKFGGHAMAAGLDLKAGRLGAFRAAFNRAAAKVLRGTDLRPVQRVDAWISLAEVDDRFFDSLERMRPFGHGNPTPVWAAPRVRLLGKPRVVGQKHVKMLLASGGAQREAIGFGMADREIPEEGMDVAFTLRKDSYMGRESLVLNLQDWRPCAPASLDG